MERKEKNSFNLTWWTGARSHVRVLILRISGILVFLFSPFSDIIFSLAVIPQISGAPVLQPFVLLRRRPICNIGRETIASV